LFGDLLEGLVTDGPLRPGADHGIHPRAAQNLCFQRLQIFAGTVRITALGEGDGLVLASARGFWVVKKAMQ
jgi:hypothetical protein